MLTDEHQEGAILAIEAACEAVQSPLQKFEHLLQPWIAFGVMPIFALANAGVVLPTQGLGAEALPIALGVIVGLVVGKPIGLIGTTWLVVRLGIAHLPQAVTWRQIVGVGCLAGLGFTMSLFIATLGFEDATLLEAAKLGILAASVTAGLLGYGVLWAVSARTASEDDGED
jgi:NhaA family Na+:H+ antiporter